MQILKMNLNGNGSRDENKTAYEQMVEQGNKLGICTEQERQKAAQQEQEREKAAQQEQERERILADFARLARFVGVKVTDGKLYTGEVGAVCKASIDGFERMKKALLNARERARELEAFQAQSGSDEAFQRWQAAQKKGRAQKDVDWARYEKLIAAGVPKKDIARYLGMSTNTLRKCEKERKQ